MAQQAQEDGYYPRINHSLFSSGKFNGMIVSLVGTVQSCDGSAAMFKCADGGVVRVMVEPDFSTPPGGTIEIIGHAGEDGTVQVCRSL